MADKLLTNEGQKDNTASNLNAVDTHSIGSTNVQGQLDYLANDCYGGFYAYNKAIPFNITVANTYHALYQVTAADLTQGLLLNFTFNAGRLVDPNILREENGTGGKLRIICNTTHGLATGDLVVLGNMITATNNKPTRITLDGTNPTTEFLCDDISYAGGTQTSAGTVTAPAYLLAGAGAGGVYCASFTVDGTAAQLNKVWKWEFNLGILPQDNIVSERNSTTSLTSMTSTGNIAVVAGDKLWLSAKNSTDTSDYVIKNLNINLHKI